jgi:hypothetical protein
VPATSTGEIGTRARREVLVGVFVVAGSTQADPGLAAAVGEELAASIAWR